MPSSSKTTKLKLNKFVGSDKPKMDDINYDNAQIETIVGSHLGDLIGHITSAERVGLFEAKVATVTWTGEGSQTRITVQLPFVPKLGVIFVPDMPLFMHDAGDYTKKYFFSGIFSKDFGSLGISISGTTLTLKSFLPGNSARDQPMFNVSEQKYICLIVR